MASSTDFVEYVCGQIAGAGLISSKRMFGEYGIYCDGKFFGCICDNQFLIKITEAGMKLLPDCETAPPYEGGKPYFLITELDDMGFLSELIKETCDALPMQKRKNKKSKGVEALKY